MTSVTAAGNLEASQKMGGWASPKDVELAVLLEDLGSVWVGMDQNFTPNTPKKMCEFKRHSRFSCKSFDHSHSNDFIEYLFSLFSFHLIFESPKSFTSQTAVRNSGAAQISWPGPMRFHHFGQNAALPGGSTTRSQQHSGINHGSKAIIYHFLYHIK